MVKYNLDFQLTQKDARKVAENALVRYANLCYGMTLARRPFAKRDVLENALTAALEEIFAEKFERALNVCFSPSCRILLVIEAYRAFEERRKAGKIQLVYEQDFARTCASQIEWIADQMILRRDMNSEFFETEPSDEYGEAIEYELAEDVEHAWHDDDWTEFDHWDEDFQSVAAFAVVALSE